MDTQDIILSVHPKDPNSRWVALDNDDNIISEGKNPKEVTLEADKTSKNYFIMFVPTEGNTYIF